MRRAQKWADFALVASVALAPAGIASFNALPADSFVMAADRYDAFAPDSLVEAVVHTTLRPPSWDVYVFDAPGAVPRPLTDDPSLDYTAVFSPDGRWVVFTSERTGRADLDALDLEGDGEPERLTRHSVMDDAASCRTASAWRSSAPVTATRMSS